MPSAVLLPDERAWVDGAVGTYQDSCCRLACKPSAAVIDAGPGGSGAGSGSGSGSGSGDPGCTTTCVPEGVCETRSVTDGLVVMVSSVTTRDCSGSCPAPASDAPEVLPACDP
jgi:hypothetical protein